jgi:hypothetical protein
MHVRRRALAASLVAAATATATLAQGWQLTPVEVDPGPLMLFIARDDAQQPRVDRWHVVGFRGDGQAREFLRLGHNLSILARLDLRRLLVASHGDDDGIYALDLQQAKSQRLSDNAWTFVGTRGGDVLYLGDERKNDRQLYARPWTHLGEPRVLAGPFARVTPAAGDVACGIGPGDAPEVHLIDLLHGGSRCVARLPAGHGADSARVAVAPDGKRVAIGTADGTLRVYGTETAEPLREWRDIPLQLPFESSFSPRLELGWSDDDVVVCSESRQGARIRFVHVRRSVASGKVLDETPYQGNLVHQPPVPPPLRASRMWGWGTGVRGRWSRGPFECEGDDLFLPGESRPVASRDRLSGDSILFTPDAAFAAVTRVGGDWVVEVIDGGTKSRRRVFTGWTCEYAWLPAAQ